jgi:hypothetical protein
MTKPPPCRLFVVLAREAPGAGFRTAYKGTWTAISRPPWLPLPPLRSRRPGRNG